MHNITRQIAAEIKVTEHQVRAAVELLDGGATVPFIARYRKEATGASMTFNCASWSTGWATCVSWKRAEKLC